MESGCVSNVYSETGEASPRLHSGIATERISIDSWLVVSLIRTSVICPVPT